MKSYASLRTDSFNLWSLEYNNIYLLIKFGKTSLLEALTKDY